jgi:hypothetical protein
MFLGREVLCDASEPLATGRYKGNRSPAWSHENSAGFKVLLEGEDSITEPEGRDPASVKRFKTDEEVSIACKLETEWNKFGICREPYIAQPSSPRQ